MPRHTFKKAERLTNKKTFDQLFKSGKSIVVPPFRWVWIEIASPKHQVQSPKSKEAASIGCSLGIWSLEFETWNLKLGISVPKKSFSKAVQRNRIKRRIREAYRKNKHLLYPEGQKKMSNGVYEVLYRRYGNPQKKNLSIALMIIYTEKTELPYSEIEKKMLVSLQKLVESIK
ncbi:MAG: ribonuclease P protein component [Bacteroidetes bacterium]|nr:ribonuclease P protein component [Bacteroidota bacterium]